MGNGSATVLSSGITFLQLLARYVHTSEPVQSKGEQGEKWGFFITGIPNNVKEVQCVRKPVRCLVEQCVFDLFYTDEWTRRTGKPVLFSLTRRNPGHSGLFRVAGHCYCVGIPLLNLTGLFYSRIYFAIVPIQSAVKWIRRSRKRTSLKSPKN